VSNSRKKKSSITATRRPALWFLSLFAIVFFGTLCLAQTNTTNTTQTIKTHCPPSEGNGPPKPCGQSCCTGLLDVCADSTTGLCCLFGEHASKGICCPTNMFNCGGTCCGGRCLNLGVLFGGKDAWLCSYTTDEQCQGIGGLKLCKSKADCPSPADTCSNGCCFKPSPHPG
jgi:hypothetical protein